MVNRAKGRKRLVMSLLVGSTQFALESAQSPPATDGPRVN